MRRLNTTPRLPGLREAGRVVSVTVLLVLVVGLAADAVPVNIANLQSVKGLVTGSWHENLPSSLDASAAGGVESLLADLARVRWFVGRGRWVEALDHLETESGPAGKLAIIPGPPVDPYRSFGERCYPYDFGNLDVRVGLCEPALSLGLQARRAAAAGDWSGAVDAYRELFVRGPSSIGDKLLPEYHLALAHTYELAEIPADQRWRAVWHYWVARKPQEAAVLAKTLSSEDGIESWAVGYGALLRGEELLAAGDVAQARSILLEIPSEEQSAYLRSRILLLQHADRQTQSDQATSHRDPDALALRAQLRRWAPTIPLGVDIAGVGRLVGVQVLEPEFVGDGGTANLLLFWDDISAIEGGVDGSWIPLGGGSYLMVVTTRNLVPDPGFEWLGARHPVASQAARGESAYWGQGFGWAQPAESWRLDHDAQQARPGVVACLDNSSFKAGGERTGLQTWFVSVEPDALYLMIGRMRGSPDAAGGVMGSCWDHGEPRCNVLAQGPTEQAWQTYARLMPAPAEARMARFIVQNRSSSAEVCFDDVIMVSVPLP